MIACLLCKNSHELTEYKYSDGQIYFACGHCDFLFLNSDCRLNSELEQARYLTHENDPNDKDYLNYLNGTWAVIEPYLNPESLGVDYGCGPTEGLKSLLKDRPFNVISYDPYFFPIHLKKNVDFVFCSEAVEHFYEPRVEWQKWATVLGDTGYLVLRTEFKPDLKHLADWYYRKDPTHVGFYSSQVFHFLAEEFGFSLLHCQSPYVLLKKEPGVFREPIVSV